NCRCLQNHQNHHSHFHYHRNACPFLFFHCVHPGCNYHLHPSHAGYDWNPCSGFRGNHHLLHHHHHSLHSRFHIHHCFDLVIDGFCCCVYVHRNPLFRIP